MNKKNSIKKMISLLCAMLLIISTVFAGLPGNVFASAETAPPTDFTEIGWTDFGFELKEYIKPSPDETKGTIGTYSASLNETLLNANIILGAEADIRYAGQSSNPGWSGLVIRAQSNGTLLVNNSTFDTAYNVAYNPADYGLTSFAGVEFNLKISTEIDGNNYTFGIWVNDKILGDYFTLAESEGGAGNIIGLYDNGNGKNITLLEAVSEDETIAPPTDFTEIGWTDFGFELKEYIKPSPDETKGTIGTYSASLNETLLNANIILGAEADIRYAGQSSNPGWSGLVIRAQSNGTLLVNNSTFDTPYNVAYNPADYGLTSFAGVEFNLKISTEIDGNNYTFGIWVNDKILGDYFTLTESEGGAGNIIGLYDNGNGKNITLLEAVSEDETIAPPTDFAEIGWTDFGFELKEYIKPSPDETKGTIGTYSASLNETLLNANIILGAEADIRYAGQSSNPGWSGLVIRAQSNGTLLVNNSTFDTAYNVAYNPADYGLTSFAGVEFNLKISTEIDGNNYTFGIWVNDKILGDYFTLTESEGGAGNIIGLYDNGNGKNITLLEAVSEDETIAPPTDFTELGWTDFGFELKEYVKPSPDVEQGTIGTYSASLNETLLNGDIILDEEADIRYAGQTSNPGWSGLVIRAKSDGTLLVNNSTFDTPYNVAYNPSDYDLTSFAGVKFNLKISTEIDGNNYTFGIWVNDKMLGDYFTLTEADGDTGSIVGMYDTNGNGNITLVGTTQEPIVPQPPTPIAPPTDFTEIGWTDFGFECKEYVKPSPDVNQGTIGTYSSSLNETLLNGDIILDEEADIRYAGQTSNPGWSGLVIRAKSDGTLLVNNSTFDTPYNVAYNPSDYDLTSFAGVEFNLKISTEIDGNNYTFGIWVNDKILGDYFTLTEADGDTGSIVGIYDTNGNGNITLVGNGQEPIEPKPPTESKLPDEGLKKLSFSSFGIEDAEYVEIDPTTFCASGTYYDTEKGKTLDGTLFHGKVKFGAKGGAQLRFGGLENAWCGLVFLGNADGTMTLTEAELNAPEKQFAYYFIPSEAGCQLVGEWLDLKISTQFVDCDNDGATDDVKLGIWFNDVLYQNEYIFLCDYAPHMGAYMSVYSSNEEGYISIQSVEVDNKIDLGLYGFDDNYLANFMFVKKDIVKGEPLGVTVEYDTVYYEVDAKKAVTDDKQEEGNTAVHQAGTLPFVIIAVAGAIFILVLATVIFLFVKKRTEKNENYSNT